MENNTEARANIIAEDENQFSYKLQNATMKIFNDIAKNGIGNIVAIQFKEVEPCFIADYIDMFFRRADGQYVYRGNFVRRKEIEEKLNKYSRELSVSIVPKDLGKGLREEKEYKERFGYINITKVNMHSERLK